MIEGVEVLSVNSNIFSSTCLIISAACFFALAVWVLLYAFKEDMFKSSPALVIIMCIMSVLIGVVLLLFGINQKPSYKVRVENSVEFNSFMENYNILNREGEIWTIEFKGGMNESTN